MRLAIKNPLLNLNGILQANEVTYPQKMEGETHTICFSGYDWNGFLEQ